MEIVTDGEPPMPANEANVRAAFGRDGGFWDFVILSRGEFEFVQAAHCQFMARKSDSEFWLAGFEAATVGQQASVGGIRELDLHAVEFRDADGQFGVHQVLPQADLLRLFLAYLVGGDAWRAGMTWEKVANE